MRISILLYAGGLALMLGGGSLVAPALPVPLASRTAAGALCVFGLVAMAAALAWPVSERHVSAGATCLDALVPEWQFDERHEIEVAASPDRAFEAIRGVTAREILFFRTLTAIRRFGLPGRESILNAPRDVPILDVATRSGFETLAVDSPRELVVGIRIGADVLAAMSFLVSPVSPVSCTLSTETRVAAAGPRARRRFALYWRAILPGSDVIRRSWLRAIKRRAEAPSPRPVSVAARSR